VVLADHRDLQFFARAKVGKHAGLAHARDLGQRADAQALQPDLRGQAERGVHDGGLGLLTLEQRTALPAAVADDVLAARRGGFADGLGNGHGFQTK
jgi:hypothetical protein